MSKRLIASMLSDSAETALGLVPAVSVFSSQILHLRLRLRCLFKFQYVQLYSKSSFFSHNQFESQVNLLFWVKDAFLLEFSCKKQCVQSVQK